MAEFKVGEVVVDLFTLKPVRVIRQSKFDNELYLVKFEDGHEEWAYEGNLRHRVNPREVENAACGFCVALDGGTCVDCAGYENVAAEDIGPEDDVVNHPRHYTVYKGVEVIQLTEQMNFNRGNAVKYIARAGLKNPATEIEDLEKARWYIDREIKRLKEKDG